MDKFNQLTATTHELKSHPQYGDTTFEIQSNKQTSKYVKCKFCGMSHYMTYYIQKGKITYYYCEVTQQWENDIPFSDF